jgi:uncharacterized repeat protein (TIGR01451 family)
MPLMPSRLLASGQGGGSRSSLVLALLLSACVAGPAFSQAVPAQYVVHNEASVVWEGSGRDPSVGSVSVSVARTVGLDLLPSISLLARQGERVVVRHTLTNRGNATDEISLSTETAGGWSYEALLDADRSGAPSGGDVVLPATVRLAPGGSIDVFIVVTVPDGAADADAFRSRTRALSGNLPSYVGYADATVSARIPSGTISLEKSADRSVATLGDTIVYLIRWRGLGPDSTGSVVLYDPIPSGVRYVEGSMVLDGRRLTDAADADPGAFSAGSITVRVGSVAPGELGILEFRAVALPGEMDQTAHNVAEARFDGFQVLSDPASVRLVPPRLDLDMTLDGPSVVRLGAELPFTLIVSNPSDEITLRNVLVTADIPPQLAFLRGRPSPYSVVRPAGSAGPSGSAAQVDPSTGGGAVSWLVPVLAPGDTTLLYLDTRAVAYEPRRIVMLGKATTNVGEIRLDVEVDVELEVDVEPPFGLLDVTKSPSRLDVQIGEAVGYSVRVRNTGLGAVRGVILDDILPEGVVLQPGSLRSGVDAVLDGGRFRIELPEPLPGGGEFSFSYAVTVTQSVPGSVLLASAFAVGAMGEESDTAVAIVRLRRGMPAETRAVIARVWHDRNANGRQDPDEPGAEEVVVWSSSGERSRSDLFGRLSFPDLEAGWHVFRLDAATLPAGWRAAPGLGTQSVRTDGWSTPALLFPLVPSGPVQPSPSPETPAPAAPVRVSFSGSPVIVTPTEGQTLPNTQAFVRFQGRPMAPYELRVDGEVRASGVLRPDGSEDFVALPLEPGPHRITFVSGAEESSVQVHVSGPAHRIVFDQTTYEFRAGARSTVRARVLDAWGVPLATRPIVTVSAMGARVLSADEDPFSVGIQIASDTSGEVDLRLRADSATTTRLSLWSGEARADVGVTFLPEIRPAIVAGAAQVGFGAAPESFGAVIGRTSLGSETQLTLSYDSRLAALEEERRFGAGFDPFEDGRYSTLGDRSEWSRFSGRSPLSARVERGLNWIAYGDVDSRGFGDSRSLTSYGRTLEGGSARLGAGPFRVHSFASMTDQRVLQVQLRGDGTSGPYALPGRVVRGTERIAVEARSREDAAILLGRRDLVRYLDYDIDYTTGLILLRQPLLASDASGNPLFLVVIAETGGATEMGLVGGVKADFKVGGTGADSLVVGGTWIEDRVDGFAGRVRGTDARVHLGGLFLSAEAAHAESPDSVGAAFQATGSYATPGSRLSLGASYLLVQPGFYNPANVRMVGGLEDLSVETTLRPFEFLSTGARYQRQSFRAHGVERTTRTGRLEAGNAFLRASAEAGLVDETQERGASDLWLRSVMGRLGLRPGSRLDGWVEGTRPVDGTLYAARPERLGFGAGVDLFRGLRLEGSHRVTRIDTLQYRISGAGLRTELPTGTTVGGELQHAEGQGVDGNSVLLSGAQRLSLGRGWEVDGHYSRRIGLDRAELIDPARALPFTQAETNRWSAGVGFAFRSPSEHGGMNGRIEWFDGVRGFGIRGQAQGDAELTPTIGVLIRHDVRVEDMTMDESIDQTRAVHSAVGLAYRPIDHTWINVLAKMSWREDHNPLGAGNQVQQGDDQRWVTALEGIFTPAAGSLLGIRHAFRRSIRSGELAQGVSAASSTHYVGGRVQQRLYGPLDVRAQGRYLREAGSGFRQHDLAPALGLKVSESIEIEGGHRFGTLRDRDLARDGGEGWYATLGLRFSEDTGKGVARFWRERIRGGP